jgi:hypothetical protein
MKPAPERTVDLEFEPQRPRRKVWEAPSALTGPFDVNRSASAFVTDANIYNRLVVFAVLAVRFFLMLAIQIPLSDNRYFFCI